MYFLKKMITQQLQLVESKKPLLRAFFMRYFPLDNRKLFLLGHIHGADLFIEACGHQAKREAVVLPGADFVFSGGRCRFYPRDFRFPNDPLQRKLSI